MEKKLESMPKIISFHVGKTIMIKHGKKEVPSAIFKQPSNNRHWISKLGVQGDEQGDTVHHGGADKAICVYLQESYKVWEALGRPLTAGAFGENMTISGLTEETVAIGDTFRIGTMVVQVSQPRQPCFKLGIRNEWPELVQLSKNNGYTGYYMRVLEEGEASVDMELELIEKAEHSLSIKEANHIMYGANSTLEQWKKLASIPELADAWKSSIHKKLT
ncbi:MOSC domain-containing protein [Paenibacillus septentrionalis]|uniref:MOSC domain-containing protein n=1 Tax=Paenibacillus septentrionalis TaxID=429342 RepID=A0ABW1V051_9BACL